jgi:hypothetical protein
VFVQPRLPSGHGLRGADPSPRQCSQRVPCRLRDAFTAAQLSYAVLTTLAIKDDTDLLFRRIVFSGRPLDVFDDLFARAFPCFRCLCHVPLLVVTMSQKHSLIKSPHLDP